jgi:hypothetical protein
MTLRAFKCASCRVALAPNSSQNAVYCSQKCRQTAFRERHRARLRAKMHEEQVNLKSEVFNGYGGVRCAVCGLTDLNNLVLNHISGGGNEHRKQYTGKSNGVYRELIRMGFPPGYNVLCFGCNNRYRPPGRIENGKAPRHEGAAAQGPRVVQQLLFGGDE